MIAIKTGLIWADLKDVDNLDDILAAYSYQHPRDENIVFHTCVLTDTRVGLPSGNVEKYNNLLHNPTVVDQTIATPMDTPKQLVGLTLRNYQAGIEQAIISYIKIGGTSFNLAGKPGSGKSVLLASLIAKLGVRTLVIAHLSMLIVQLKKEIEEALGCSVVLLDKDTKELGDINIATSQFISQNPDLWYKIKKGIGLLVADESESLASKTTLRIFQRAHARYRIAVTATFTRSVDGRTDALTDMIGTQKFVLENPDLLVPNIMMVHCEERFPKYISKNVYARQKAAFFRLPSIDEKVVLLTEVSLNKNRQVLIATDVTEMQERLANTLSDLGISVGILNSATKKKDRVKILEEYDKGDIKVLIAGMVVNAGLSIPRISTIIRVSFPASKEKNVQLVGRSLRDFDGKDGAFMFDLVFGQQNPAERVAGYTENGYKVTYHEWQTLKTNITYNP